MLHAKICQLTLENDFLAAALGKAGTEAVEEALARYGKPDIFNTDRNSPLSTSRRC